LANAALEEEDAPPAGVVEPLLLLSEGFMDRLSGASKSSIVMGLDAEPTAPLGAKALALFALAFRLRFTPPEVGARSVVRSCTSFPLLERLYAPLEVIVGGSLITSTRSLELWLSRLLPAEEELVLVVAAVEELALLTLN